MIYYCLKGFLSFSDCGHGSIGWLRVSFFTLEPQLECVNYVKSCLKKVALTVVEVVDCRNDKATCNLGYDPVPSGENGLFTENLWRFIC